MLTSIPNTVAIGTRPDTVADVRYAIWMYVGTYETTENSPTPITVDRMIVMSTVRFAKWRSGTRGSERGARSR